MYTTNFELNILIAGDIADDLVNQLQNTLLPCQFILAHNKSSALVEIESRQFALIFIESTLVTEEFIWKIKRLQQDPPLLALLENEDINKRRQMVYIGFDDCIIKPLTMTKINEATDFWLSGSVLGEVILALHGMMINNHKRRQIIESWENLFNNLPLHILALSQGLKNRDSDASFWAARKLAVSAKLCMLFNIEKLALRLETAIKENGQKDVLKLYRQLKRKINLLLSYQPQILKLVEQQENKRK